MNAVTMLKRKQPAAPSPERAALADVIRATAEARAEIAAIERAVASARQAEADARAALEKAEAGIADASESAVARAVNLARGVEPPPALTVREAREAHRDAEDALALAVTTEAELRRRLRAAQDRAAAPWVAGKAGEAARAVVRAEAVDVAHDVAQRVARLQRELIETGELFKFFADMGVYSAPGCSPSDAVRPADPALRDAYARLQKPPAIWNELIAQSTSARAWQAALAALATDAAAPMPSA